MSAFMVKVKASSRESTCPGLVPPDELVRRIQAKLVDMQHLMDVRELSQDCLLIKLGHRFCLLCFQAGHREAIPAPCQCPFVCQAHGYHQEQD